MSRTKSLLHRLPDFYDAGDPESVLHRLMSVFGETLDEVESDLVRVLRGHWVDTADNEGSRGLDTTVKGDLDRIFSLYLESLGGTSRLRQHDRRTDEDDVLYRNRIRGLIEVLRGGASTPAGIVAVVAANLGLVGDEAREARERIRLVEFLPEPKTVVARPLALYETFEVDNPNPVDTTPRIRLSFFDDLTMALLNPRLVNLETGDRVGYRGGILPGDHLDFFAGGDAWLNGIDVPVNGALPALPPGASEWRFEADIGLDEGSFDLGRFDASLFQASRIESVDVFDDSLFDQAIFGDWQQSVVALSMTLLRLEPASFRVCIPWRIPGYTEGFENGEVDPRRQIPDIVDRVKAAGVHAEIVYQETFSEQQDLDGSLTIERMFSERHRVSEADFVVSSTPTPEEHEQRDRLLTTGAFDLTYFDSLNTFA